jgi:predicted amidohydrolase YtcJ
VFAELHIERGRIRSILPCPTGTVIRNETDTWSFPGCHVLPGFVDAHCHLLGLGEKLDAIALHHATSEAEAVSLISAGITPSLEGGIVYAMGWNQALWPLAEWPTAASLDAIEGAPMVVAGRIDGHALWVSSNVVRAAGITSATPDPPGGRILRDADGLPTGVLIDTAMDLVYAVLPAPTAEVLERRYIAAAKHCAQHGITEVHDMAVQASWLEPLRALAEGGKLPIRIQSMVSGQHNEWLDAGLLPAGGELLRIAGVKLFADGALGSRGAFLSAPYHDEPTTCGLATLSADDIVERAVHVLEAGWWILCVHAIGDAAVSTVLDAFERVRELQGGQDVILRLEHAQHMQPQDVTRCSKLNVIASVQPTHCISDAQMAEQRLGTHRLPWSYRWRSLLDAEITVCGGSDFPIEDASVIRGIDALCRRVPVGFDDAWQPQEIVGRDTAIKLMTLAPHVAADVQYRRGRMEIGYDADFVVLDRDLALCATQHIADAVVMGTFVAGKATYIRTPE